MEKFHNRQLCTLHYGSRVNVDLDSEESWGKLDISFIILIGKSAPLSSNIFRIYRECEAYDSVPVVMTSEITLKKCDTFSKLFFGRDRTQLIPSMHLYSISCHK